VKTTDAFRIASVTKVYVAATAIRLIEQGKFGIYDPMSPLISDQTRKLLKDDGYDVDAITVFQLLTHTSGLYDNSTSPAFAAAVMKDPGHKWTREEQIAFGMKNGEPVAPPGRDYNYSELSYLVLGEIIERATGKRLADAVSYDLQLPARGLSSTYWETYQPAPAGERRAHQYVGPLDARVIDASMDLFGGGGLVSTVGDLVRFVRPLLQGDMFDKSPTLAMALQIPPTANGKLAHAPLLGASRFGKRMCWSHGGYWGVSMVYCPRHRRGDRRRLEPGRRGGGLARRFGGHVQGDRRHRARPAHEVALSRRRRRRRQARRCIRRPSGAILAHSRLGRAAQAASGVVSGACVMSVLETIPFRASRRAAGFL
jgi:D-alanyl-D-alanine carboxypeptidase